MKKNILIIPFIVFCFFSQAQTVSFSCNSGPSFKAVNYSPAFAGANWNQPSYNDSAWGYAYNGGGLQSGGNCDGPNQCAWCTGDTVIWSSSVSAAPDTSCFRKVFTFSKCGHITAATFSFGANDFMWAYLNGHFLDSMVSSDLGVTVMLNATQLGWMTTGANLIAVEVNHPIPYCGEFDMVGTVTVDTTGCAATTGIVQLGSNTVSVYPNPATTSITIDISGQDASYGAHIYDMLGHDVLSQHITGKSSRIDISLLAKGTYTLRLTDAQGQSAEKAITKY